MRKRPAFLPKRSETEAQSGMLQYLRLRGDIFFWRQNVAAMKKGKHFIRSAIVGCSDILCCQAPTGRFVGIEMKKRGEVAEPAQLIFDANLTMCGGLWFVAYEIADAERELGPPRARVNIQVYRERTYPT